MAGTVSAQLIHRWFDEIWNAGRIEAVDEMMAPDGVLHDSSMAGVPHMSPATFKAYAEATRAAIPDIRFVVEECFESGERVAARVTLSGTHTGPGLGIEPTGRSFRISGIVIARITGGVIAEGWNAFDLLGLFVQLGLVARPELGLPADS